ncbi:MAG: TolC family protein [Synergistales bacterium]
MRKISSILGTAALALALLLQPASETSANGTSENMSIERVTELALKENPLIGAAVEKTNQARARLQGARSGFGPKLDLGVSGSWLENAPLSYGTGTVIGGPADGSSVLVTVPLGFRETYRTALSLSQVLFSSGSLSASRRAAELNLSASSSEETRTRQAVRNNVQVAFFTVQRSFGRLRVAEENLGISREHLKQVEAFFRAGFVAINEVLRVQVSIAQAEQERISAENAVRTALAGLQRAVGSPIEGIVDERRENPPKLELEGDRIAVALKMRPELAGLTASRKAAEETARAYAGRAWPQVVVQGEVSRTDDQFPPGSEDENWNVILALQWRLYDHGETKSRVNEAKALARELLHRYKDLENQVVQDVTVASSDLESATARISVAREQVAKAREDYRIAMLRYETQVGTNLDVLDARASLVAALNSLVDSIYDAAIAESKLVFAVGDGTLIF